VRAAEFQDKSENDYHYCPAAAVRSKELCQPSNRSLLSWNAIQSHELRQALNVEVVGSPWLDPFLTSDGESVRLVSILKDPETEPSRAAVTAFDGQQAGIDRSDPTRRNP
tara:strand:+ start:680 stop:1009 length:330 start_codon:yes stop_codon:yes gene_type:complete